MQAEHRSPTGPNPNSPIGVFDSGVGGLTVARSIIDQLPNEEILYVGDTAHAPYGPRPIAQVRALALGIMDELVEAGVKALVIACNSASAAVLRDARERYTGRLGIPVVEVIQPAVRRAVSSTRNGRIGVIATQGTVTSRAYEDAFAAAPALEVTSAACPRFVEFVERGEVGVECGFSRNALGILAGIDCAVVDLPEPDSPTMASTSPSVTSRSIPAQARRLP